jgi:LuxR family maltose regulon positive regulatory protein
MLQSPQPPPMEVVLTPLINELVGISDRIIFVLDDNHLIEDQPIQETLGFMIEKFPR